MNTYSINQNIRVNLHNSQQANIHLFMIEIIQKLLGNLMSKMKIYLLSCQEPTKKIKINFN